MSDLRQPLEPFALQLFRRYLEEKKSIADLASELDIPQERVDARIRAAIFYCFSHPGALPKKFATA